MAPLRIALATLLLIIAAPANAETVQHWRSQIEEASARFGIPVEWIEQVMQAESGGRTTLNGRPITSRAGAMGLMQLMPGTWADMRARLGLGRDLHDPRDNILAGTAYLRLMYDRFGYPGLFAAYNAGPARYAAYLAGATSLPGETRAYLTQVASVPVVARRNAMIAPSPERWPVNGIFFALKQSPGHSKDRSAAPAGLFIPLGDTLGE